MRISERFLKEEAAAGRIGESTPSWSWWPWRWSLDATLDEDHDCATFVRRYGPLTISTIVYCDCEGCHHMYETVANLDWDNMLANSRPVTSIEDLIE